VERRIREPTRQQVSAGLRSIVASPWALRPAQYRRVSGVEIVNVLKDHIASNA
jgi:hypothetical protein